jgi:hypothetical protein
VLLAARTTALEIGSEWKPATLINDLDSDFDNTGWKGTSKDDA